MKDEWISATIHSLMKASPMSLKISLRSVSVFNSSLLPSLGHGMISCSVEEWVWKSSLDSAECTLI